MMFVSFNSNTTGVIYKAGPAIPLVHSQLVVTFVLLNL